MIVPELKHRLMDGTGYELGEIRDHLSSIDNPCNVCNKDAKIIPVNQFRNDTDSTYPHGYHNSTSTENLLMIMIFISKTDFVMPKTLNMRAVICVSLVPS